VLCVDVDAVKIPDNCHEWMLLPSEFLIQCHEWMLMPSKFLNQCYELMRSKFLIRCHGWIRVSLSER